MDLFIPIPCYISVPLIPLQDLMFYYFDGAKIVDGAVNDTRIVGTITLICVLALAIVGMDWVTRVSVAGHCTFSIKKLLLYMHT